MTGKTKASVLRQFGAGTDSPCSSPVRTSLPILPFLISDRPGAVLTQTSPALTVRLRRSSLDGAHPHPECPIMWGLAGKPPASARASLDQRYRGCHLRCGKSSRGEGGMRFGRGESCEPREEGKISNREIERRREEGSGGEERETAL